MHHSPYIDYTVSVTTTFGRLQYTCQPSWVGLSRLAMWVDSSRHPTERLVAVTVHTDDVHIVLPDLDTIPNNIALSHIILALSQSAHPYPGSTNCLLLFYVLATSKVISGREVVLNTRRGSANLTNCVSLRSLTRPGLQHDKRAPYLLVRPRAH